MKLILFFAIVLITNFCFIIFFNFFSKFYNLFDNPSEIRKKQKSPVSLFGGVIFLVNFSFFIYFDLFFQNSIFLELFGLSSNLKIFLFIFIFYIVFLIGYSDDKINLRPLTKIILISLCLFMIFNFNERFSLKTINSNILGKEIDLFFLGMIFSALCVLTFMNAMNMFDGINLSSFLQYFCIALVLLIDPGLKNFGILLMFSLLIFGYLNFKNFTFLGDSGVYILSFISGLVLIKLYEKSNLYVEDILIIIFLPMIDFFRLFFSRIISGKSPFLSDEDHFHHHLIKKYGYTKTVIYLSLIIYLPVFLNYVFGYPALILLSMIVVYFILLKKIKLKFIK